MSKMLFFDLETTGTKFWRNGIHQISGAVVIDNKVVETFNWHVQPNPKAEIEEQALQVAGVTREQVMAYPPMQQVYSEFVAMLGKYVSKYDKTDKFTLAGYNNSSFDNPFLRAWFVQNGDNYFGSWFWSDSVDVMVLASYYVWQRGDRALMQNFKQGTVAEWLGLPVRSEELHDALYDIKVCMGIFQAVTTGALELVDEQLEFIQVQA